MVLVYELPGRDKLNGIIPYGAQTVTPDDDNDLPGGPCIGLELDIPGTVRVTMGSGEVCDRPLQAGQNPGAVKRVHEAGTDSGLVIVALYPQP